MQNQPGARSRKGCLTCRSRKVKCDEVKTVCGQCTRLSLQCTWGAPLSTPCQPVRPAMEQVETISPTRHNRDLNNSNEVQALLAAYFRSIHPFQANGFLHQGTLERDIAEGTVDPLTVKTICAVSARYLESNLNSGNPDGGEQAAQWAQEVKNALMTDTDRLGYPKLVAALCLVQHELTSGRNASAWVISALAVRLALAMGLNSESEQTAVMPQAEQEFRRRLMWSAYSSDCICNGGLDEYTLLHQSALRIPLPASEYTYSLSLPNRNSRGFGSLEDPINRDLPVSDGLMARYIRLMAIRTKVLRYVNTLEAHPKAWEPGSMFEQCVANLRHWNDTLPVELHFTIDNLHTRRISNQLGAFLLVHMWYDHIHAALYRLALAGSDESASAAYLQQAPEGWISKVQYATYLRACAVRQKFILMNQNFPAYRPENWQFATLAIECSRNLLQYFTAVHPVGLPEDQHRQALQGFEDMVTVVTRTAGMMHGVKVKIRDLVRILSKHGFQIAPTIWEDSAHHTSGAATPARGPVLNRLPMFRRHLRYPQLEEPPRNRVPNPRDAVDPISNEYMSTGVGSTPEMESGEGPSRTPLPTSMTADDYLSWLPEQQPAYQDDLSGLLWGSFPGSVVPDLGWGLGDSFWNVAPTAIASQPDDPSMWPHE